MILYTYIYIYICACTYVYITYYKLLISHFSWAIGGSLEDQPTIFGEQFRGEFEHIKEPPLGYGGFLKWGYHQIIHFNGICHYKRTILDTPIYGNTHMNEKIYVIGRDREINVGDWWWLRM